MTACFAFVDIRDGVDAEGVCENLSAWFSSRGRPTLIVSNIHSGGPRSARGVDDVLRYARNLGSDALRRYLSHNGDMVGKIAAGGGPLPESAQRILAGAYDNFFCPLAKGPSHDILENVSFLPALIVIDPATKDSMAASKTAVECLLRNSSCLMPAAFVLKGGDCVVGARISKGLHLPTWGFADDLDHLSARIIERAHRISFERSPSGGGLPARIGGVVSEVLDSLKDERIFDRIGFPPANAAGNQSEAHEGLRDMVAVEARRRVSIMPSKRLEGMGVERIVEGVVNEAVGFGPLDELVRDPEITEIMANGNLEVYVEREGVIEKSDSTFRDRGHLLSIIERMVSLVNRRIDESSPMVDARLPDGSRINAIIPPVSVDGPTLTIRRFKRNFRSMEDLIAAGMMGRDVAEFLSGCVRDRVSMVVSGGTGSGKTTLLGVLASAIPSGERIITIEDAAELSLAAGHVVRLEARPPNIEGAGVVAIRDLVRNALRMRPDRIIVGECRGPEALDMLQAMNTGHEGSLTSVHANSPRDALARLETMVLMSGIELPVAAVREQIVRAIGLVIQVTRDREGGRRIVEISELTGMEGQIPCMQTLAVSSRRDKGGLRWTGLVPKLFDRMDADFDSL